MDMLLHQPRSPLEQKWVWMMILSFECEVASTRTGFLILVLFGHSLLDSQPGATPAEDFVHI
jgi:hypothetical protein